MLLNLVISDIILDLFPNSEDQKLKVITRSLLSVKRINMNYYQSNLEAEEKHLVAIVQEISYWLIKSKQDNSSKHPSMLISSKSIPSLAKKMGFIKIANIEKLIATLKERP